MIARASTNRFLNINNIMMECISERTCANVARYASATPAAIDQRLRELNHEWDVERTTALVAALGVLGGVALVLLFGNAWLIVPILVGVVLLVRAVSGWSLLLPLLRGIGIRPAREIAYERYALKALRGDFQRLDLVLTPQDREDLSRFEDEGGAIAPTPSKDASDPAIVNEAIRAVQT